MNRSLFFLFFIAILACPFPALAQAKPGWKHTGEVTILTTPEGANIPAGTSVAGFPLLVRLHEDYFDFSQAKSGGEDIRFSSADGKDLAFEIENWDAENGTASIWVRIPRIKGNARQTIHLHWGKVDSRSASNGRAVFNESNGFLSVWHLGDEVRDEVGTLESTDVGTTPVLGMVGKARHFPGKKGVFCGDKIPNYPAGESPHTTSLWFRAEKPNTTVIGWGNEGGGRGSKIRMQFRSPPHIYIDSDFSDVKAESRLPMNEWIHVVHTYGDGPRKMYINGKLDGQATTKLDIKTPCRLWLGGWYHNYDFVGDIDEVRVSTVPRSADWVRLQYENQKPLQSLVGHVQQSGKAFGVSPAQATVKENSSARFRAQAGGAQKILWSIIRDGRETLAAVDRFEFNFEAGRITGDTSATLRFKALYPDGAKSVDIPITIEEHLPDPEFTLRAPATWNGRSTIEIVAGITKGGDNLHYDWNVSPIAVGKEISPGKLTLNRAQNSGRMTVTATVSNGGQPITQSLDIMVTEPKKDPWSARRPEKEELPEEGQFLARDDIGEGTVHWKGSLPGKAESVFIKLFADEKLITTKSGKLAADNSYALSVQLKAGLIKYRVELGTKDGDRETILHDVDNLVCGDAYLVTGQSNAEATGWGKGEFLETSEWIRSFGSTGNNPQSSGWGNAIRKRREDKQAIGYWGYDLAKRLVASQHVPIFIINGAAGGTRIDQHQRNDADPTDLSTIYGRLLWRVREARLAHGIRGVLWHQGENDQGAAGPSGGFGWETYRENFINLAAAWKRDFPNIRHYYVFQIWPKACSMGIDGSDNRLREIQRTLPTAFSNLSVMSTLGIDPPGSCHYPPAGYAEIARLITPLVERDHYGVDAPTSITPPNLVRAFFSNLARDAITLEFDQPLSWEEELAGQFYLDGERGAVASGTVAGNTLALRLTKPVTARTITYLDSASWNPKLVLRGTNEIAALTFCEVPINRFSE